MYSGNRFSSCEDPPSCDIMEEDSSAPSLATLQCILCRKIIESQGGISFDPPKNPHSNDAGHDRIVVDSGMEHHSWPKPCKANSLGHGINVFSGKLNEGGSSSATGFSSFPVEAQTYLKDMDSQIRTLQGGNYELKRTLTHLFSLVQTTNAEVHGSSVKIYGQVNSLAKKFESGCPCFDNLAAMISEVHSCAKVVEGKIESMHVEIKILFEESKGIASRTSVKSAHL